MSVEIHCPNCHQRYAAPDRLRGTSVKCPACQGPIVVPTAPQPGSLDSALGALLAEEMRAPAVVAEPFKSASARAYAEPDEAPEPAPKKRRRRSRDAMGASGEDELSPGLAALGYVGMALVITAIVYLSVTEVIVAAHQERYLLAFCRVIGFGCRILSFLAICQVIRAAFYESTAQGVLCCFVPLYVLGYGLMRWKQCQEAMMAWFFLFLLQGAMTWGVTLIYLLNIFDRRPQVASVAASDGSRNSREETPTTRVTIIQRPPTPMPNDADAPAAKPKPPKPEDPPKIERPKVEPKVEPPRPKLSQEKFRDYVAQTYIQWIAGDDQALVDGMRWFAVAKRPAMGVRWGLGICMAGAPQHRTFKAASELVPFTGPIGPTLVSALQERLDNERWGIWPAPAKAKFPLVPMFESEGEDKLAADAAAENVDALVAILLTSDRIGLNRKVRVTMRVQLMDVFNQETTWTSAPLSSQRAVATRGTAEDAAGELVAKILQEIDTEYALKPMPRMSAEIVRRRTSKLVAEAASPETTLRALAELRYYQARKLLSDDDAQKQYGAILGERFGPALTTGATTERERSLIEWFLHHR